MKRREALYHNETSMYFGGKNYDIEATVERLVKAGHSKKDAEKMAPMLGGISVYETPAGIDTYDFAMEVYGSRYEKLFPRESFTLKTTEEMERFIGGVYEDGECDEEED